MTTANYTRALYVDDERNDLSIFRYIITELNLKCSLTTTSNVKGAIAYLEQKPPVPRGDQRLPDLVILDLRMKPLDGFAFLAWRQSSPSVSKLPTVVLTDSNHEADVRRAFELKADEVFFKPKDLPGWKAVVSEIFVWFEKFRTRKSLQ